jgi:hypothetical protein
VSKALVTFGSGPAAELLEMALPTFRDYAQRHGYELVIGEEPCERPPAWTKIPLLQRAIETHQFVLWLDADAIILDPRDDIEAVVPQHAFQAFNLYCGSPESGEAAPCTGVWALRAGTRARDLLAAVWAQDDLAHHPYWEQAALMRLMGWTTELPIVKQHTSEWDDGTAYLADEWNVVPMYPQGHVRIRHRAGWEQPLRRLDMATDAAKINGPLSRYWLGLFERHALRPRGIRIYDRKLTRAPQALRRRFGQPRG